jgi:hypothetical protein
MRYLTSEINRFFAEGGIDPNLKYFHDRLKPSYSLQVVRAPRKNKSRFASGGAFSIPDAHFMSFI